MRVRTLLVSAAVLVLASASAVDVASARGGGGGGHGGGGGGHGGGGFGGGGHGNFGGGGFGGRGGPSFSAAPRGGLAAAPSFRGETTGAAPNVRASTFSGNAYRGNFVNRGNNFAYRGNWHGRDHDHDRGRFRRFGGGVYGYPYYDDDYSYNNCSDGNYYGWGSSSYDCGPYAYYGGDYSGSW